MISACCMQIGTAEPLDAAKGLSSQSCMTSGCHGGAGPDRGAYNIWKLYDPHHVKASATLNERRSEVMAKQLGIENAAESKSCTICHSPMQQFAPARLSEPLEGHQMDSGVSCANCHGPAENWLLSHTRPDYPKDALARLGMRQLGSAYQRANNCVACHQNLSDELVRVNHPRLTFELDGLLVAEPKHWREEEGFSNAKTWLVGQAVALREVAAQANREPSDDKIKAQRTAEIEAIRVLLRATGTGWDDSGKELVRTADEYAKRISGAPMTRDQARMILTKLVANRTPFEPDAFSGLDPKYRPWSVGCYAERLTLAIDRLNQALIASGQKGVITKALLDELFDAAKPPASFDAETTAEFVRVLDLVKKSLLDAEQDR